ncbi:MAG TPA: UDP-N-acetylmuramoyl-tripeptide--D-alanyl-D-alanine ligase [Solibacterales bacterium]|nr:UDP-N-acetylmuramoyl-tripeptide--D-alanyl-D-alanine ligase [Bryobacterales bacterium]
MTVQVAGIGAVLGWSIDTRTLAPGDLFFALRGPVHDGHDHVAAAFEKGAIGAVVDHAVPATGPLRVVSDTLAELQRIASAAREQWGGRVIGVTGSAGKTTTKDAIAQLLSVALPVGKTVGNFNNQFGLPLSILRLPDACRAAVLELGMNHAGEIAALARLARPEIGVVTNVGYAHVEFFDSIDAVAAAKRELIEALPDSGVAVLNADDPRVAAMSKVHKGAMVTYGVADGATVRAENIAATATGSTFDCQGIHFETPLAGLHGVRNTLAAIAVAHVFGIPSARLVDAVRGIPQGKMRGERLVRNGVTILNDSYNSNPEAACSMLDVLAATPAERRIAVMGSMLELGAASARLHGEVGQHAAAIKIDVVVGIGEDARVIIEEASRSGVPETFFFSKSEDAGAVLAGFVRSGDAILFKGSRGVQVERALEPLLENR